VNATNEPTPLKPFISVVIPALNEEAAIEGVVRAVPLDIADDVIVVDNGSDDPAERAIRRARVVSNPAAATDARAGRGKLTFTKRRWSFVSRAMAAIAPS
jgi:glycosyltransferase involved in cell wall biosynthesis